MVVAFELGCYLGYLSRKCEHGDYLPGILALVSAFCGKL
jgi:hypothetical protein